MMKYLTPQYVRGMSIIELLVYAAVLSILTVAVIVSLLSLRTVFEDVRTDRTMADAGVSALDRLARDIRDADRVNTVQSTLNATSSVLVLESGATTTTYRVSGGALELEVGGVSKGSLIPEALSVTNFGAVRYVGAKSDMVRVTLDLRTTNRYASTTKRFTTAAVLRGSYEE